MIEVFVSGFREHCYRLFSGITSKFIHSSQLGDPQGPECRIFLEKTWLGLSQINLSPCACKV